MKKLLFLLTSMSLFFSCCNKTVKSEEGEKIIEETLSKSTQDGDAVESVEGKWIIEEAMGKSTQGGDNEAIILFNGDGTVGGNTSINSFGGEYTLNGNGLTLYNIALTQMMGESIETEQAVIEALNNVASIKMADGKLEVLNKDGNTVLVLKKK